MIQPFCHLLEHRVIDGCLHLSIQTRATHDTPDIDGVMVDNSIYRHLVMDLDTGELVDNYLGPISL